MKPLLMHPDRDFDPAAPLPANADDLVQDLELDRVFDAMAEGDAFLREAARSAVLASLADPGAIRYRQQVLADCLAHPEIPRSLYDMAAEAIDAERSTFFGISSRSPETVLMRAIQLLESFMAILRRLRSVGYREAGELRSEGFARFFAMLERELDDAYFATVQDHLRRLKFPAGVLISARLGKGGRGTDHVLRQPADEAAGLIQRLLRRRGPALSFEIADRDESGHQALAELRARGVNLVANALAQASDHILAFFRLLRAEAAFYVGCLNLADALGRLGEPTCLPAPLPPDRAALSAEELYDPCLALRLQAPVVGNRITADGVGLVVITGANQGGKSTFLRSLGVAQLMMQCGMFVAGQRFAASVCTGLHTHFKREEDRSMAHGKLEEELDRMRQVVDRTRPAGLLLSNESFASTNEREGAEIASQIVRALLAARVRVALVTHMTHLAEMLRRDPPVLFLRAGREPDGRRTYRLIEGEPEPTSHARDLYERIFAAGDRP